MSSDWLVVKVGGSVLTGQDGSLVRHVVEGIGRELLVHSGPAAVVHGTGHIGRSVLQRHGVSSDYVSTAHIGVVSDFRSAVSTLKDAVDRVFRSVGLRCNPMVPHEHFHVESHRLVDGVAWPEESLPAINLLHGDALADLDRGYYFCSGDELVARLAARLRPKCVVFLTDVDGVYESYPPEDGALPVPVVDAPFAARMVGEYVVGEADMVGKVKQALRAAEHARRCYIANGTSRGLLSRLIADAMHDGDRFTRILDVSPRDPGEEAAS